MKTCLTIVPYQLDDIEIDNLLDSSNDILVLSMPVMLQLDRRGINYLTLNSFITQDENFNYLKVFSKEFMVFLNDCDQIAEEAFHKKLLFSFNGFRFYHRCEHLMFSQMLMDRIDKKYDEVFLFTKNEEEVTVSTECNFSSLHLPMENLFGLDGLVNCFLIGFSKDKLTTISIQHSNKILSIANYPYKIFFRELPNILVRKIRKNIQQLKLVIQKKDKLIWVDYVSYDLERIQEMNPDVKFIAVMDKFIEEANLCHAKDVTKLELEIEELSKQFFKKWLPRYSSITVSFFKNYTLNVVSKNSITA